MEARNVQGKNLINFSKALSKVLRHDAEKEGLNIRPDGFININEVLEVKYIGKKFKPTMADFEEVVNNNNKKRFELKQNPDFPELWMIRAVQGHTMENVKEDDLMEQLSLDLQSAKNVFMYPQVIHGTYRPVLDPIMENGLCRMARNHVHMAQGLPGDGVISGMRNSCEIVVEVNLTQAAFTDPDLKFFVSQNGVILSPGVGEKGFLPSKYFRSVFDAKTKAFIYQQPLDFICVYDFECNCSKDLSEIKFNEIIEFPVVIVDVKQMKVAHVFHTYVRPTAEEQITPFCTELTGITNE